MLWHLLVPLLTTISLENILCGAKLYQRRKYLSLVIKNLALEAITHVTQLSFD